MSYSFIIRYRAIVFLLICSLVSFAQESLLNPEFTSNLDDWTVSGNIVHQSTCSGIAAFNQDDSPPNGILSQDFTPILGANYFVSIDFSGHNDNQNLLLEITNNTTSTIILTQTLAASNLTCSSGNYVQDFVAPSSDLNIRLTDISSATISQDFHLESVSIQYDSPPTANCQNLIVSGDSNCEGIVLASDFDNGSSDPEGGVLTFSTNPSGPYTLGETMVVLTVTDPGGSTDQCSATITVNDTTGPVADVANLPDVTGICSATVSITPTATDNCTGVVTATTTDPINYDDIGTYVITWTYDDGNGNMSNQTQNIIVNAPPAYTFSGTGNWSDETKWSPCYPSNSVSSGDIININGSCVLDIDLINAGTINNNSSFTISSDVSFTNDGTFKSDYNTTFFSAGTINNNSSMIFEGDNITGVQVDFSGTWTNNINGSVHLNPEGFSYLTIPLGSTLTNHGAFYADQNINNGGTLINSGLLNLNGGFANAEDPNYPIEPLNPGVLNNSGTVDVNFFGFENSTGSFTNDGMFTCHYATTFSSSGTIINNATMIFEGDNITGVQVDFSGTWTNNINGSVHLNPEGFSYLTIPLGSTLTNHGAFYADQNINNGGTLINSGLLNLNGGFANAEDPNYPLEPLNPGVLNNSGTVDVNFFGFENSTGSFTNDGMFTCHYATTFSSSGTIINNATMIFEGDNITGVQVDFSGTWTNNINGSVHLNPEGFSYLTIPLGSTLTNHGAFYADQNINNGGTLVNSGLLNLNGGFANAEDPNYPIEPLNPGVLNNSGTVDVNFFGFENSTGSFTNDGMFTCHYSTTFSSSGTIINNATMIFEGDNITGVQVDFSGTWTNNINGSVHLNPEGFSYLRIPLGSTLSNHGEFNAGQSINNGGILTNTGVLNLDGGFANAEDPNYPIEPLNPGIFNNSGTVDVNFLGFENSTGSITNDGVITFHYNTQFNSSGTIINNATMIFEGDGFTGVQVDFSGVWTNNIDGSIYLNPEGFAYLTIPLGSTLSNHGEFNAGQSINNGGTLTNTGVLNLDGGFANAEDPYYPLEPLNPGIFTNTGTVENNFGFENSTGSLSNDGTFKCANGSLFSNAGMVLNNDEIINDGEMINSNEGTLHNNGSLINNGSLTNNGIFNLNLGGELVLNTTDANIPGGVFNWNSGSTLTIGLNGIMTLASSFSLSPGRILKVQGGLIMN